MRPPVEEMLSMIVPSTIYNKLESYFFIWVTGENRSGKTNLCFHIAESYLKSNFRLMSNTKSVWNDDFSDDETLLDTNGMLNCIVILDEGGAYMRTKESIRQVMGFKGVLNSLFLMPSTEEPHEDLWTNYIKPHEGLNWLFTQLFGRWFIDHVCKVWQFVQFDPKKIDKKSIFFELFPSRTWGIYSTISKRSPEIILSTFQRAFQAQQEFFGNEDPLGLYDLATKKSGLAENSSFFSSQMDNARAVFGARILRASQKGRK